MPRQLLYSLLAGHTGGFVLGVLLRFAIVSLPPSFQEGFWEAFLEEGRANPLDTDGNPVAG